jgi:hypothetical protein
MRRAAAAEEVLASGAATRRGGWTVLRPVLRFRLLRRSSIQNPAYTTAAKSTMTSRIFPTVQE